MKKIISLLSILCLAITGAFAQEQVSISRFQGEKITAIKVIGAFEVTARQGESTGISVSIPARLAQKLILTLKNGELLLSMEGKGKWKKNDKCKAEITVSSLEKIELSGACSLDFSKEITTDNFKAEIIGASSVTLNNPIHVKQEAKITLTGASKLSGQLTSQELICEILGASQLTLSGESEQGKIKVVGASHAYLDKFLINIAEIKVTGASKADIHVVKKLSAEAYGVSSIAYTGDPEIIKMETAGISKILPNLTLTPAQAGKTREKMK